ncbi:hypothetical protein AB0K08_11235 [Citricoccus sp. NPDC055426]|uniref:hypothetical protein n=1 Tax=Citricoccus sp. NPDC055426 TaxID=3155536 RepID=UPI00343486A7
MKTVTDVMNEQASYDLAHGVVAPSSAARINPVLATPGLVAFGAAFAKGAAAGGAIVSAGIAAYTVTADS